MWRKEDADLLARLEDEVVLERLVQHHTSPIASTSPIHPRAAGLVALVRGLPEGREITVAALAGNVVPLVRFLEREEPCPWPPALLHHVALYYAFVARTLEATAPDAAANAWKRSLVAWFRLGEESAYVSALSTAIVGAAPRDWSPFDVALFALRDLGARAARAAPDLLPAGRAALLALSWLTESGRASGLSDVHLALVARGASRCQNAALDAALAPLGDALDEAHVQARLSTDGPAILARAVGAWAWSSRDEAVEHFVATRFAAVGWELYRARAWDKLRAALAPLAPLVFSLAERIERDPSNIAYAAPCAQMLVFLTDTERDAKTKLALAERAVRVCPIHRNARLNLASLLCGQAVESMRKMVLFARTSDVEVVKALLLRAETLYPELSELPIAKATLSRLTTLRMTR